MFKLKKIKYLIVGVIIGSLTSVSFVAATPTIKLIVNGVDITYKSDVPPQIIDGRTVVPARALAESLGASVEWDEGNNAMIVNNNDGRVIEVPAPNAPVEEIAPAPVLTPESEPALKNIYPLRLDNIGETTYKSAEGTNNKYAYVTVTITNTTDKYIPFIRLIPILNVNDGRSYTSAMDSLEDSNKLEDGYYKPNSSVTVKYWTYIPNEINIVDWKLYN